MKKKLALLLAGVMVAAVVPVTAMAGTSTYVNKVVTLEKGKYTNQDSQLVIKDGNGDLAKEVTAEFTLELDGAEWGKAGSTNADIETLVEAVAGVVEFNIVDSKKAAVVIESQATDEFTRIPLYTKATSKGDITVTVDGKNSVVSSATCTYAVAISGSATAKIAGSINLPEDPVVIKNITISESAAGALETGTIKLKLNKGFKFTAAGDMTVVVGTNVTGGVSINPENNRELLIPINGETTKALEFVLKNIKVATDDAKVGAVAEITVSGAGMDKTTFTVGTYTDYGVKIAIYGDDDVPTFYSGKVYTKDTDVTLPIQLSENVADSYNGNRKLTFTFPEGVKVTTGFAGVAANDLYVKEADGETYNGYGSGVYYKDQKDSDAWDNYVPGTFEIKNNVVTFRGFEAADSAKKLKMTFAFNLAISPEFTGDVDVVVGGAAVDVEETLTVAKVVPGYTVEANVNEVAIDYRNVAVSDIVIKEAKAGVFAAGEKLYLQVENMQFEKGMDFEVTAGDLAVKKVEVNRGVIAIEIKEESAKEAGEITLSGVQLYLDRALPAGDYDIITLIDGDHFDYNQAKDTISDGTRFSEVANIARTASASYFDIDDVTLVKGYIKVVTAGRDVDDSTFTTKIVVPVGEKVIKAGDKDIAIDVPAFINADGYTMMPLRAVVQALSGTAIVTWDTETKTATVLFGARVISMTIGQKHMVINGVDVAMLAAPVIVESRTFLPLRDLGYALGLNESQVNWNSETKTATLN